MIDCCGTTSTSHPASKPRGIEFEALNLRLSPQPEKIVFSWPKIRRGSTFGRGGNCLRPNLGLAPKASSQVQKVLWLSKYAKMRFRQPCWGSSGRSPPADPLVAWGGGTPPHIDSPACSARHSAPWFEGHAALPPNSF